MLWRVYLRTYRKPGPRRNCAIVAVSQSTVGNGVGEKSPYHLPARQRKRKRKKRRRTRTTLRRHQRQQPARLHSREQPQPIWLVLESFLSLHIKEFWLTLDGRLDVQSMFTRLPVSPRAREMFGKLIHRQRRKCRK